MAWHEWWLELAKVVISWPTAALAIAFLFRAPIERLSTAFAR